MPSRFKSMLVSVAAALSAVVLAAGMAQARDLTIAIQTEPTSLDPHFHALTPNFQISSAMFDTLVGLDTNGQPIPALAESWTVDGDVWTFKLRSGVKFSDGSDFTAEDVVFSYQRAPKVPNSPSSLALYLSKIDSVRAVDPLTLEITTKGPAPVLPQDVSVVRIMSHTAGAGDAEEGRTTVELNRGEGLVGTGPYKFVSWQRGAQLVVERNPDYWGPQPEWDKVIYRPIANPAARVAALRSGNVDVIENPPTDDVAALRKDSKLHVQETPSLRVVYIALVQSEEPPSGMSGTNGKNPLTDVRVREALSLAINRDAIVERVMAGVGKAAANLLAYPGFGVPETLDQAPKADPTKARALLEDAGYGDGFTMSLGSPDGRYVDDKEIAQAIASMWARLGIKVDVETMAPSVFFKRRGEYAFSAYLAGWAVSTGEMINPLNSLLLTRDKDAGRGTTNWTHYSNPELDQLVIEASQTLDDDKRAELLKKAATLSMGDYAMLPIEHEVTVWAMKGDLRYAGRADQETRPQEVVSAK